MNPARVKGEVIPGDLIGPRQGFFNLYESLSTRGFSIPVTSGLWCESAGPYFVVATSEVMRAPTWFLQFCYVISHEGIGWLAHDLNQASLFSVVVMMERVEP